MVVATAYALRKRSRFFVSSVTEKNSAGSSTSAVIAVSGMCARE